MKWNKFKDILPPIETDVLIVVDDFPGPSFDVGKLNKDRKGNLDFSPEGHPCLKIEDILYWAIIEFPEEDK